MQEREYEKMAALQRRHWWFAAKRLVVRALLDAHAVLPERACLLEVGCGTGAMVPVLRRYGHVVGLDRFCDALRYVDRYTTVCGDGLRLPFAPGTFDLVACFDVLYHVGVTDVTRALAEVSRVLKRGGYLVFTDSALPILYGRHDRAHHGVRRFTRRSMESVLHQAGFSCIHISYYHFALFPITFLLRMGVRAIDSLFHRAGSVPARSQLQPTPGPLNAALGYLYRFEAAAAARTTLPIGSSLVGVARARRSARADRSDA